jgi:hypothetical protein
MQNYANIITQSPRTPTLPDKIPGTHNPDWDKLLAVGWRKLDPREPVTPPDGEQVAGYRYEQDAKRKEYALEITVFGAVSKPGPDPVEEAVRRVLAPVLDAMGADAGLSKATQDAAKAVTASQVAPIKEVER